MHGRAFGTSGRSKIYGAGPTAVHALRGVNVEIPTGELVVLLGPSASGKSTLLNFFGGIDRVSDGEAVFEDEDIVSMSDRQLTAYRRRHVGFVFECYKLMPGLTALENVERVEPLAFTKKSAPGV